MPPNPAGAWLTRQLTARPKPPSTADAFAASTQDQGARAGRAYDSYESMNEGFNPESAYRDYATGAFGDFQKNLGRDFRTLGGRSVGAGRFDSGLFDEDQGEVIRDTSADFSNILRQGALSASGQRLSQIGQTGAFAQSAGGEYNDMLAGTLDREQAAENAKRQRKDNFWSGLLGVGGAVLGGPIGGAIGGWAGKKLGAP